MTVDAIKDAITGLPDEDKIALATWLSLQTMDEVGPANGTGFCAWRRWRPCD